MRKRRRKVHMVAFSGPDGSGKSTQIDLLCAELERRGQKSVVQWLRLGYTPCFEGAKALARNILGKKLPQQGETQQRDQVMGKSAIKHIWLAVASADLILTSAILLRVQKLRGRSVICDRYIADSLIDRRLNFPNESWLDRIIKWAYSFFGTKPDVCVLLMLPLEEAQRRLEAKDEPFPDSLQRRAARHQAYYELCGNSAYSVIDAARPASMVAQEIAALLDR